MSLRNRLLLGLAAVAMVLIASDVVLGVQVRSFLRSRVDRELLEARPALGQLVRRLQAGSTSPAGLPGAARPAGGATAGGAAAGAPADRFRPQGLSELFVEALAPDGTVLTRLDPGLRSPGEPPSDVTPALVAQWKTAETAPSRPFTIASRGVGPSYRMIIVQLPRDLGTGIVAISLREVDATFGRLVLIESAATTIVLLALFGVAWWVLRLGVHPLAEMAQTADAIAAGELSRRVSRAEARTEVGRLGLAFNAMVGQIEEAFAERKASEDRLRRFVADASHELRTPLTSIGGYAELWRQGGLTEQAALADAMARIEQESARMGVLVDDLLLLARLDQGRPLERQPVDLSQIATDAARDARAVEPGRPITVRVPDALVVVGDEHRLRQVAANLLSNVRVHTPEGTPAQVSVSRQNGSARLEVTDQGPGLDPESAGRAFERFYRAQKGRSGPRGTGLGLAIVAAVAEAHGGRASVESSPGFGATFVVEIPVGRPGPHVAPPPDAPETASQSTHS